MYLWDVSTSFPSRTFSGHKSDVVCCAFDSTGSLLVSCSEDNTLKIWSVDSGLCLRTLTGHTSDVIACCVSQEGTVLSGSLDCTSRLWNIHDGRELGKYHHHNDEGVWGCLFAPSISRGVLSTWELMLGDD
jgi:WD40 repeat protein